MIVSLLTLTIVLGMGVLIIVLDSFSALPARLSATVALPILIAPRLALVAAVVCYLIANAAMEHRPRLLPSASRIATPAGENLFALLRRKSKWHTHLVDLGEMIGEHLLHATFSLASISSASKMLQDLCLLRRQVRTPVATRHVRRRCPAASAPAAPTCSTLRKRSSCPPCTHAGTDFPSPGSVDASP